MYTSNWLNEQEFHLFKPHGLTLPQYNVLRILRGQVPNSATVSLIMDRMLDRMSNVSRIVDKLVLKELVIRGQNAEDRRTVDVKITDKGLELLSRLDIVMKDFNTSINVFTEEESKQMNAFLDRFRGTEPD